jgi:hypothetical protein
VIWFVFLVMCLTAYRATRLLIKDTFPPVLWLRDILAGGWRPPTEAEWKLIRTPSHTPDYSSRPQVTVQDGKTLLWVNRRTWAPDWLAELITCPWCASAYISGGLTAAVDVFYGVPVPWLVGPAVWAVSALLASREWA